MSGCAHRRLCFGVEPDQLRAADRDQSQLGPVAVVVRVAELSGGYSPREVGIDEAHVAALQEVLDRLPPILVEDGTMCVIDGLHRLEAFRRAGRAHIKAVMFSGDQTEALALAISANVRHGKPLTSRERQGAAARLLRQSPDRSDRWVGEICGLSHSTVAKLRRAVSVVPALRTGRDGRRRPVDPLPGQLAVAKSLAEAPERTLREAADVAGVAISTVHRATACRAVATLSPRLESDSAIPPWPAEHGPRLVTTNGSEWAHFDTLTGLSTRAHILAALAQRLATPGAHDTLVVLDITGLNLVNDAYGLDTGDKALAIVGARLRTTVREADVVARVEGGEFVVLLRDVVPQGRPAILARLLAKLREPLAVNAMTFVLTVIGGVALCTPDVDADELLRRAQMALAEK